MEASDQLSFLQEEDCAERKTEHYRLNGCIDVRDRTSTQIQVPIFDKSQIQREIDHEVQESASEDVHHELPHVRVGNMSWHDCQDFTNILCLFVQDLLFRNEKQVHCYCEEIQRCHNQTEHRVSHQRSANVILCKDIVVKPFLVVERCEDVVTQNDTKRLSDTKKS